MSDPAKRGRGAPNKLGASETLQVRIPVALGDQLRARGKKWGASKSETTRRVLEAGLELEPPPPGWEAADSED